MEKLFVENRGFKSNTRSSKCGREKLYWKSVHRTWKYLYPVSYDCIWKKKEKSPSLKNCKYLLKMFSLDSADHMISAFIFYSTKYISYFSSLVIFCFDLLNYSFLVVMKTSQVLLFFNKLNNQLIWYNQQQDPFNWYSTSYQELFGCLLVNEIILNIVYIITYLVVLDKLFAPWLLLFSTLSKIIAIMMKVMVNILILLITILWIAIRKEITKNFGNNFVSLKTKSESVESFLFYC